MGIDPCGTDYEGDPLNPSYRHAMESLKSARRKKEDENRRNKKDDFDEWEEDIEDGS